jgi:2-polyprenyl-3-methyl-5-hydroxy-6-metoxy-1,4-benzoquinol methylase
MPQPSVISAERIPVAACPVCRGSDFRPVRTVSGLSVVACPACGVQFSNPQPSDRELAQIYGPDYFLAPDENFGAAEIARMKQATADLYLDLIERTGRPPGRRLLELGSGHGDCLVAASRRGYEVTGVEYSEHACGIARAKLGDRGNVVCGEIDALPPESRFDVAMACDVIEHVRNPGAFLQAIRGRLSPNGLVFLATPSLDSWSARVLGRRWMEYKPEHLTYFSARTLRTLLEHSGFAIVAQHPGRKVLSFDYVAAHFARFPVAGVSPLVGFAHRLTPRIWRSRLVHIVASGMIVQARSVES